MNKQQVWAHLDRKYKDGVTRATFLYEVFYNRRKLVSRETYNSIHTALTTPICTGVIYGMQATQIQENREKIKQERERPRTKEELEENERRRLIEWEMSHDPNDLWGDPYDNL